MSRTEMSVKAGQDCQCASQRLSWQDDKEKAEFRPTHPIQSSRSGRKSTISRARRSHATTHSRGDSSGNLSYRGVGLRSATSEQCYPPQTLLYPPTCQHRRSPGCATGRRCRRGPPCPAHLGPAGASAQKVTVWHSTLLQMTTKRA